MTDQNIDDGALAALIACLDPVAFPHEDYTTALSRAEGDVARAAEILLLGEGGSGSGGGGEVNGLIGGRQGKRRLEHYFSRPAKASRKAESELLSSASLSGDGSAEPSPTPTLDRAASASQWATLLRPPPPSKPAPTRSGPIHLTSPSAVAGADIPLAVLPSPLTPSQAAALYHEMLAESPAWPRNKWYLAGREVESNHQATSYSRPGGGFGSSGVPYFYASRKYNAKPYPLLLSQAAAAVEEVVNAHLATLPRFAWEYRGKWRANMCAANRYDGAQATVGWHADQMTYLGPYPTIASLSLGTPRAFRLRPTEAADEEFASSRPTRTYEVTLGHNSLCLMTPGCQERYKHTVPPQRALDTFRPGWDAEGNALAPGEGPSYNTRINITFRFYRDDFNPSPATGPYGPRMGTPICKCGIPTLLRADQKAKARSRMGDDKMSSAGKRTRDGVEVVKDDMAFFWQCQSPGTTGQLKGCGFFKILDMRGEGRGPCIGYGDEGVEAEVEADESDERPGEAKAVPSSGGEDTAPVIETTAADP